MSDTKIHFGVVCRSPALAVGGRTALNAFGSWLNQALPAVLDARNVSAGACPPPHRPNRFAMNGETVANADHTRLQREVAIGALTPPMNTIGQVRDPCDGVDDTTPPYGLI